MNRSAVLALFSLPLMGNALQPEKPVDWRAAAIGDLQAAYKETAENHPGMFDKTNPGFPKLLGKARAEAMRLAQRTSNAAGYEAVLGRFKSVLNDGHAGAYADLPDKLSQPIQWPGFVAAWRGDAMYVYQSAKGGPAAGAKITLCDGQSIRSLVERNVFAYTDGRQTPGEWWSVARRVFVNDGNPFVTLPKTCVFQTGGKSESRTLRWSAVPDYYQAWKNGSANGDRLPIGMTEKAPGLFWFAMPDYQPDDAGVAAYKKLYADTDAQRDRLLKARGIVLDLRFNQGGSSDWSLQLAQRLWGKARVTRQMDHHNRNVEIWWRPTAGNIAEIKQFIALLEKQGNVDMIAQIKQGVPLFEAAMKRGDQYFVEPVDPGGKAAAMVKPAETVAGDPPMLTVPVYIIVPGQCASACLDALDYFKRFANTKLIGAPSSADSTYMEVRSARLPSGLGNAIIPMKMWVNRPRGNGEYYSPDIVMTDFDWSTANFQKRIEADLIAR
jgi:hypothetical protein